MVSQFAHYLGLAEADYSRCQGLVIEGVAASPNSVFGLAGHRVMQRLGKNDVTVVLQVEELAFEATISKEFKHLFEKAMEA